MKFALVATLLTCFILTGCNQNSLVLEEKNPDGIVFTHQKKVEVDPFLGFNGASEQEDLEYYYLVANHIPKGKTFRLVVRLPDGSEINGGEYRMWNGALQSTEKALKLSEVLITASKQNLKAPVECYLVALDNSSCVKTTIMPTPFQGIAKSETSNDQDSKQEIAQN